MWFSGFRGAMAYALSIQSTLLLSDISGQIILTLTIYISIVNIFIQGTLLLPILEQCHIQEKRRFSNDLTDEFQSVTNRSCCQKLSYWFQKCEKNVLQKHLIRQQYNAEDLGTNLLQRSNSEQGLSEAKDEENHKAFELAEIQQQQKEEEEQKEDKI
eukprot:TRINITY_DN7450_c0_g1_i2.p2 TRINITY_DN7450_c0_g1~~TRINITY_DN7450_c0_g1_i2.p2  ORF type:complete len:157 (-),score=26.68 TRINITY_DN7450_c0_g1_i2:63-533(-)